MINILNEKINNINGVKKLSYEELEQLSSEVRDLIIKTISMNGGDLASSLGVIEFTIALLYSFDFNEDKIIWNVGHQSYAYKIITDRKEKFSNIRQFGGISGFPKRKESEYDVFHTGHSSTSISAGLGMCIERDLENKNYNIVSVIGDGSLTGMTFEALNNVSNLKSKFIIILNDNEMSISKSRGGLNKALLGIRSSKKYNKVKKSFKKVLEKSNFGLFIKNMFITIITMFKQVINKEGIFFENLNIDYVGPIDGHNIKQMSEIFEIAKK